MHCTVCATSTPVQPLCTAKAGQGPVLHDMKLHLCFGGACHARVTHHESCLGTVSDERTEYVADVSTLCKHNNTLCVAHVQSQLYAA